MTITLDGLSGGASGVSVGEVAPQGVPFEPGSGVTGVTSLVLSVSRDGTPLYFDASGNELPSSVGAEPIVISSGSVTLRLLPGTYEFTVTGSDADDNVLADGSTGEIEVTGHTTLPLVLRSFLGSVELQAPTIVVPNQIVDVRLLVHPPERTDLNVPTSDYTVEYTANTTLVTPSPLGVRFQVGCQAITLTADVSDARTPTNVVTQTRHFTLSELCEEQDTDITVDTTPPTLTVNPPEPIQVGEPLTLTGTVTDDQSGVLEVTVHDGPVLLGAATIANNTWDFTFTPTQDRTHHLTVTATDQAGNQTTTTTTATNRPTQYQQVSAGERHSCAVTTTGDAYCWGRNQYGQLGDGTTTDSNAPVKVYLNEPLAGITTGDQHTCAVTTDGDAYCWGRNNYRQFGDGTTTDSNTPVKVSLSVPLTSVTAGQSHTCGLTTTGDAYCWGINFGQLGDGTTGSKNTPVKVLNLSAPLAGIAGGGYHSCGITIYGDAYCWGLNQYGQFGDGTTTNSLTPIKVMNLPPSLTDVAATFLSTCVLTSVGDAYCWGLNYGQLGDGSNTDSTTPVKVLNMPAPLTEIAAGPQHTCGLTAIGDAYCWGSNGDGRLGDGTNSRSFTPVEVDLRGPLAGITTGDQHTCAVTTAGGAYCWGGNNSGQLGDGTTGTNRLTPVRVVEPVVP